MRSTRNKKTKKKMIKNEKKIARGMGSGGETKKKCLTVYIIIYILVDFLVNTFNITVMIIFIVFTTTGALSLHTVFFKN